MSESKSPGWMRGAQIGLGIIAIILSLYIIAFPAITLVTIVYIIGIILLVVGIFEIITGIFGLGANRSRWGSVGLGILAMIIAGIALAFPTGATYFVIILLAVALLFIGISHVIRGVGDKRSRGWARAFSIGAGALSYRFVLFDNVRSSFWCSHRGSDIRDSTVNNRNRDHRKWNIRKKNAHARKEFGALNHSNL